MSFQKPTKYLRPLPHFLKYFSEVSSTENIGYGVGSGEITAWRASDSTLIPLSCKNFGVRNNLLISVQLENGELIATTCTPEGQCSNSKKNNSICLSLQPNETCVNLIQQNNLYLISTSAERLFLVDSNLSTCLEIFNMSAGMLAGLTLYASSFLWVDTRKTVSLTKYSSGILHLTSTHAHIWDFLAEEERLINKYQIRRSVPALEIISNKTSQRSVLRDVALLYAVLHNDVLYVLALVGLDYNLYSIVQNSTTTQTRFVTLHSSKKNKLGNVGLLLDPIKICEDEIYIFFRDRVLLSHISDFETKPVKLEERHILGSACLDGSILFYTSDGIYERVNAKDEIERTAFSAIIAGFLSNSIELNQESLKPLISMSPNRMFELVRENCLPIIDNDGKQNIATLPNQSTLVQTQLKVKSTKIAAVINFFELLDQYRNVPDIIMCLLQEYAERLRFATILRDEYQKNEPTNVSFLQKMFFEIYQNSALDLQVYSLESAALAFFTKVSQVTQFFPQMIDYQLRTEVIPGQLSSFRSMFELIVSACHFFKSLLTPQEDEEANRYNGFVPYYALPSTLAMLEDQFLLIRKFFHLLKQSNNLAQIKISGTFDQLYSCAYFIADLILRGYSVERYLNEYKEQEFNEIAMNHINFLLDSHQISFVRKLAKNYHIFQILVQISDEKELENYKKTFAGSSQFASCLYLHYWSLGKISTLLEDPFFFKLFETNDVLYSLHSMSIAKFEDSYARYVALSEKETNLAEKKRLVAMRKLIITQLARFPKEENQLQQIMNMQDPAYLDSFPELKSFQELLFQHHPRGTYVEPWIMMETILQYKVRLSFDDFVTLFQIFAFSTMLRNQSKEDTSNLILSIWVRCLHSTNWEAVTYDQIRSNTQVLAQEIRKTLLYQVATHAKHSIYFVPVIAESLLAESIDHPYSSTIKETVVLIQRSNDISLKIKQDEKRLSQVFMDKILSPENEEDPPLVFTSLLNSLDLKSVRQTLQNQPINPNIPLIIQSNSKNHPNDKFPVSVISDEPVDLKALPLKRVLKERNTLPLTLASLPMIPLKADEIEVNDEERVSPSMIQSPVVKIKQEPRISQSPMRMTSLASEKKMRQFSSPNKFNKENNKDFSLSDALLELNMDVDENNLPDFDGHVPETEVPTFSVKNSFISFGTGFDDIIEAFEKEFDKPNSRKTPTKNTPNRNERNKK